MLLAVNSAEIKDILGTFPEIEKWPDLVAVFDRAGDDKRPDWELPILACQAVGGDRSRALPGAVAVACLQLSIIIVDDILDDDPGGVHFHYGFGPAANMAIAYQSLAALSLSRAELSEYDKARANEALNRAALKTATGQQLDVQNLRGEESYWRVIRAKSTPFYGFAFELGAILGSATATTTQDLFSLGVVIGELIQVEDDLEDALEVPANADWKQGRNNLLLLYAQTAEHEKREQFLRLLTDIDDPGALAEAQQILVSCGAVSYASYQLINRYRRAMKLLNGMSLTDPSGLHHVLDDYANSLQTRLKLSNNELFNESLMDI